MFKKIEIWILYLIIIIFFILLIFNNAILRNHYLQGEKFEKLKIISIFFAEIPSNIKNILLGGDKPPTLNKFEKKPRIKRFIVKKRDNLLILPRYDGDLARSVVDVVDVDNFEILHTYIHDVDKMNKLLITDSQIHSRVKIDHNPVRFVYRHPLVLDDGSLISNGSTVLFRIDKCGNLMWFNNESFFHHSIMLDHEKNIWATGSLYPYSDLVKKFKTEYGFLDDAIFKIDLNGNIIFKKSIIEILFENNIFNSQEIFLYNDPIHINDIEPALESSLYWNKGDIFISIRNQSAIIHYRPETNKVINYIKGPFYLQHDVDIISNNQISIFNNNQSLDQSRKYSEVLIFDFEKKTFSKKFENSLINNNFKTEPGGIADIFNDGSLFLEEQDHGRLLFFNNNGELEWEFVNKSSKDKIYLISWARFIQKRSIKENLKNIYQKKCTN